MGNSKLDKIRKMNADNMLDEGDMHGISGGERFQGCQDSAFLNVLLEGNPNQPSRRDGDYPEINSDAVQQLTKAWGSVGVVYGYNDYGRNSYYIDGEKVTRTRAYLHAMAVTGRVVTKDMIRFQFPHMPSSEWETWAD